MERPHPETMEFSSFPTDWLPPGLPHIGWRQRRCGVGCRGEPRSFCNPNSHLGLPGLSRTRKDSYLLSVTPWHNASRLSGFLSPSAPAFSLGTSLPPVPAILTQLQSHGEVASELEFDSLVRDMKDSFIDNSQYRLNSHLPTSLQKCRAISSNYKWGLCKVNEMIS
jgi:hypothetical protein